MIRRSIFASAETNKVARSSKDKIVKVYSFFPIDRAGCECAKLVFEWNRKMGGSTPAERKRLVEQLPYLVCPKNKSNMHRYEVVCRACSEVQGYCWATDASLNDWCDFHYVQWSDGIKWRGCFTPHISPVTQTLAFECCCGQDTRDFRANMTVSQRRAEAIEAKNAIGREFNKKDSKFIVRKVRNKVIT